MIKLIYHPNDECKTRVDFGSFVQITWLNLCLCVNLKPRFAKPTSVLKVHNECVVKRTQK